MVLQLAATLGTSVAQGQCGCPLSGRSFTQSGATVGQSIHMKDIEPLTAPNARHHCAWMVTKLCFSRRTVNTVLASANPE